MEPGEGDAATALAAAARLGAYFTWEPWVPGVAWRPLPELLDGDVAAGRVEAARTVLAGLAGVAPEAVELRAAASITFLGLAARLLSPPLAALVLADVLPVPRPPELWWRDTVGGPLPVAYRDVAARPGGSAPADRYLSAIVIDLVGPLLDAYRVRFALSPRVLWGNVASALAGAAGMLAGHAPDHGDRLHGIVRQVLATGPLASTGTYVRADPDSGRGFLVRRSCCLYYRIPGGGLCADCVLVPEPVRRRQWRDALSR
jgi:ferric iron reductase protein FhuF